MTGVRVIGVGNPWRRDDGAGREVIRRLEGRVPAEVELIETDGGAAELLEAWEGARAAIVVDAAASASLLPAALPASFPAPVAVGEPPDRAAPPVSGSAFLRFKVTPEPSSPPFPPSLGSVASGHGLGLAEAVVLGRNLGRLPRRLQVYAVPGRDFSPGPGLSPETARAVEATAEEILRSLSLSRTDRGSP